MLHQEMLMKFHKNALLKQEAFGKRKPIIKAGGRKTKVIRRNAKLASVFLTILMLSITIPYQSALAAMIGTETMLDSTRSQQARNDINRLLLWEAKVLSVSSPPC